jgi:hypothetical protein
VYVESRVSSAPPAAITAAAICNLVQTFSSTNVLPDTGLHFRESTIKSVYSVGSLLVLKYIFYQVAPEIFFKKFKNTF